MTPTGPSTAPGGRQRPSRGKSATMRTGSTIALSAFFFLFGCKDPGGDDTSSSSTGEPHCTAGYGDGPEVDPNYPACGCAPTRCEENAACLFTGVDDEFWTSSVCLPSCQVDADCPTLSGKTTTCSDVGNCRLSCSGNPDACPPGYVCGESTECQVDLLRE